MLQPMAGGEHADARAVEVSGRLKAAGGATYGHGTCRCRCCRAALKGLYCRAFGWRFSAAENDAVRLLQILPTRRKTQRLDVALCTSSHTSVLSHSVGPKALLALKRGTLQHSVTHARERPQPPWHGSRCGSPMHGAHAHAWRSRPQPNSTACVALRDMSHPPSTNPPSAPRPHQVQGKADDQEHRRGLRENKDSQQRRLRQPRACRACEEWPSA